MTGFDIIVLVIIGVAAIGGFLRGLVQEVASLAAWVLAIFAIRYLHTPLTVWLNVHVIETTRGSSLLAFALLLLIPYAGTKLLARQVTEVTKHSILGPVDRVLGFCFGMVKGAIVVVMAFSMLVLGYGIIWEQQGGRPSWIVNARSYELVNEGTDRLVKMIRDRRIQIQQSDAAISGHQE
jgi:membrane protein required for colicin V production